MNYAKRAFLAVFRRFEKSLILFMVIFVFGNIMAGAIAIQQATKNVELGIKSKLGAQASIQLNQNILDEMTLQELSQIKPLGIDVIKRIGASKSVKYYDYNYEWKFYTDPNPVKTGLIHNITNDGSIEKTVAFSGHGVNYGPLYDIETGKIKLDAGRVFTESEIDNGSYVGLISSKVAKLNSIEIGDFITFYSNNYVDDGIRYVDQPSSTPIRIEVIGVFSPMQLIGADNLDYLDEEKIRVYVPDKLIINEADIYAKNGHLTEKGMTPILNYSSLIYILKSPEVIDSFTSEAKKIIPFSYFNVVTATTVYDSIAGPVSTLKVIADYTLLFSIIAAVAVISLVLLSLQKDRTNEFGIYLALGEMKRKIILQILLEVTMISIVAISFSLLTGSGLARILSNELINQQTSMNPASSDIIRIDPDNPTSVKTNDAVQLLKIEIDVSTIYSFYFVGLSTVIVSSILPMVIVLNMNPKKILLDN